MKRNFVKLFSLLFVASAGATPHVGGNEHGNGGDSVAQDFVAHGFRAVSELRLRQPLPVDVSLDELEKVVRSTRVVSAQRLTLPDVNNQLVERDAINQNRPAQITVNRTRWLSPSLTSLAKTKLALHEYLGILGIEVNTYEVSSVLASLLEARAPVTISTPNNGFVDLSTLPSEVTNAEIQFVNPEVELTPLHDFRMMPGEDFLCFKDGKLLADCADIGGKEGNYCKLSWNLFREEDVRKGIPVFFHISNSDHIGKRITTYSKYYDRILNVVNQQTSKAPFESIHCGNNRYWRPATLNQIAQILGENFRVRARVQRDVVGSFSPRPGSDFKSLDSLDASLLGQSVSLLNPVIEIEFLRDFTAYASHEGANKDIETCFVNGERRYCNDLEFVVGTAAPALCQLSFGSWPRMRVWKAGDRLSFTMNRRVLGKKIVGASVAIDLFLSDQGSSLMSIGCGRRLSNGMNSFEILSLSEIQRMFGDYIRVRAQIPEGGSL